ncbi:MAG: DUF2156 domain-containing protein [Clostridia bacterium]|nr:DUF2156 domain-containing protein [Clostridia bacterium]
MDEIVAFHTPTLEDRAWIKKILDGVPFKNCEYGFGNIFLWAESFGTKVGRYKDFLLMKSGKAYLLPIGKGDFKEVIEYLIEFAENNGEKLKFVNVIDDKRNELEESFPGRFDFVKNRDFADYIYAVQDLALLAGKKYHKKRNHLSNFQKRYNWSFERIDSSNLHECFETYEVWLRNKDAENDEAYDEYAAVKAAFDNFESLGFTGGLLRVDGKVEAFTMGEALNDEVFCTHIEKANTEIIGIYVAINNEFAKNCLSSYKYVNREEDMGIEGLRKSKLSYYPEILLEKDIALLRN